jgi:MurNAc alpha-1-phosphate uridylyltransferase
MKTPFKSLLKTPLKTMILAAGKGTRLAPLTDTVPKPMLQLAGKPLIQWQVEALAKAGVTEVIINLHHLGEQIADHLGDGATYGLQITYSVEAELLETGGGIVNALHHFEDQPFWLLNGDIWTDFDFSSLPTTPAIKDLAHVVLTPTPAYRATGDFEYHDGRVTRRGDRYVYCGIAVIDPMMFAGVRLEHFSLRDLYFELIAKGQISAQLHTGQWHDIGTVDQYQTLAASLSAKI